VGARLKACAFSAAARAAILFVSDDTKSSARGGAFMQHVWHVAHFAQQQLMRMLIFLLVGERGNKTHFQAKGKKIL